MVVIRYIQREITAHQLLPFQNPNFHYHVSNQMDHNNHKHCTLHSTNCHFYSTIISQNADKLTFAQLLFKCAPMPSNASRTSPMLALSHSNSPLLSHTQRFTSSNSPLSSSLTIGHQFCRPPSNSSYSRNCNLPSHFQILFPFLFLSFHLRNKTVF